MNQIPHQNPELLLVRTTQGQLMRKRFSKLTVGILVLAGVGWGISSLISSKKAQRENERQRREEQTRIEQAVSAMQATHNAVTDWKKGLGEALKLEAIYTVNLQRLLVREDGRPLLFYASVNVFLAEGRALDLVFVGPYGLLR
jgi:hypothetical protein